MMYKILVILCLASACVLAAPAPAGQLPLTNLVQTCDHKFVIKSNLATEQQCSIVAAKVCAETQKTFNFYSMFFCYLDGNYYLLIPVILFSIFLIFDYTSVIVEDFVAPAIEDITEALGISEALAAVTLLAFANGAGDVITALVAGSEPGGISYNIGALYGAGLFVAAVVVPICIFKAPADIKFESSIIYRDIGVYIIATASTFLFAYLGTIEVYSAILMLAIYVGYVLSVIIAERLAPPSPKDE
jgi:sodium/potassium/calcium exchanger 6